MAFQPSARLLLQVSSISLTVLCLFSKSSIEYVSAIFLFSGSDSSMHHFPQFSSSSAQNLLLLLCVSHTLALTCYTITPPAQAPDADDCTYILDHLPALVLDPSQQERHQNIVISNPLPGFRQKPYGAFQLPAHFRHGSCGIAIRANVPGGGPNPPQRGAVLPAGGSVVGDTCIPVRFIGGTLTAFWSVAKAAGQDLVKQCVNDNQQAGIEWGTFLPKQSGPYEDFYPYKSSNSTASPSGAATATAPGGSPSNYFGGANDDEAGPSDYYRGANDDEAGPSNYYGGANDDEAGPSNYQNASLYQRGLGSTLRPQEGSRMLEPRGAGQSTQGGAVEALWGVWIAGHDMPRDSLANVYDIP